MLYYPRLAMLLLVMAVLAASRGSACAEIVRVVELRDGSRLRVSFSESDGLNLYCSADAEGKKEARIVPVSMVARASFSLEPALERLSEIREAVDSLSSNDFNEREVAQSKLMKDGRGFRVILEQRALASASAESQWRLARILQALPKVRLPENRLPYDIVRTAGGEVMEGDFGDWSLPVTYRNQVLVLTRENVLFISEERSPDEASPPMVLAAKVSEHDDSVFENGRTISFDADPLGNSLEIGDDIGLRYADWGVLFQTSMPGKYVSVNDYEVAGPSRGLSAATHDPLYEGVVTVRFCVPGNPGVPAGVNAVGVWLAIVEPNGTTMQAFDVRGNQIKQLTTLMGPSEFLGIRSAEPIHAIRIVPHPGIDANYTMDDLVFSKPRALDDVGVEGSSTVRFRNGDRIICSAITEAEGNGIVLNPASFPEVEIRALKPDLAAVHAPMQTQTAAALRGGLFWTELAGGSRLLANRTQLLNRFPQVGIQDVSMVSLWGISQIQLAMPEDTILEKDDAVIIDGDSVRRVKVSGFGAKWINVAKGSGLETHRYESSPTVWFAAPDERKAGGASLTLSNGEMIDLQGIDGFRLASFSPKEIEIERGDDRWSIPFEEIAELRFGEP